MPPPWINAATRKLRQSDLVKKINITRHVFAIRYATNVVVQYWYTDTDTPPSHIRVTRDSIRIHKEIKIGQLIESDLLTNHTPFKYYSIGTTAWKHATLMERELAIQRFVQHVCQTGYQGRLPQASIDSDLKHLKLIDKNACHLTADGRKLIDFNYGRRRAGTAIITHYFDLDRTPRPPHRQCLAKAAKRPKLIYLMTRKMIKSRRQINSYRVMRALRVSRGPQLLFCKSYEALFDRLKITSVYDPDPETGVKALACACMGITYYTKPNELFDLALSRGFAGAIGLDHRYLCDGERPNCTVIDRNMVDFNYGDALDLADVSDRLMVYVPAKRKMDALAECVPDSIIDAVMDFSGNIGHFFIW